MSTWNPRSVLFLFSLAISLTLTEGGKLHIARSATDPPSNLCDSAVNCDDVSVADPGGGHWGQLPPPLLVPSIIISISLNTHPIVELAQESFRTLLFSSLLLL